MRNVNFIEVGMENFGPYIDPMILEFPNNSLTLLTGPNGIGKTMALDALSFTLFGSTSKGARGDDVVNNVVGRNCHTWNIFYVDDDKYEVNRYHKYTKLGNTVTISKNGAKPYKKGHKETLPEIERLLCPKKSFMNTLMFGQKVKDFFTDLVDSDKKDIFRKILNLSRYQRFYDRAKQVIDEIKESTTALINETTISQKLMIDAGEQLEILNKKKKEFLVEKDTNIKVLSQSLVTNKKLLDQWKDKLEQLKSKQQDWKDLENRLLELEAQEEKIDSEKEHEEDHLINQKELKVAEVKTEGEKAINEINLTYHKKVQDKKDYFTNIQENLSREVEQKLEDKNKLDIYMNKHEDYKINAEIQSDELLAGLHNDNCPTCLQDITEECKDILRKKIKEFNDNASKAKQTIETEFKPARKKLLQEVQKLVEKKEKAKEVLKVDLKDLELFCLQEQQESDHKLNNVLNKVDELSDQHLRSIKQKYQDQLKPIYEERDKLAMVARKHQTLQTEVDEVEMTITTIERTVIQKTLDLKAKEVLEFDEGQISSYRKKIRDLKMNLANIKMELKVNEEDLQMFEFWKSAFSPSGIPSMLIDEAVPFMNVKVAEYLDKLTNGRYIVSFDTLAETKGGEFRDKISVNVLDTHTRACSRIQLSGGQTRIIDIATILTLGDLQSNIQDVSFNILLFDEIFDSLDEENIGFVSKVLSNMKLGKSIYLISHRHEDQLEADEVLTLN